MRRRRFQGRILTLVIAACLETMPGWAEDATRSVASAQQPFYELTGAAPTGFEHLAAPQRGLVDLYFGGRHVATALATYSAETIAFDEPDALVAALPPSTDPTTLTAALSGALAANTDKACDRGNPGDCEAPQPTSAAVVFDEERFRADLFVNPNLLAVQPVTQSRFLPAPDGGMSLLQNFRATIAGSDRGERLFSLGSFTTVAYEQNRLVSQASFTDVDNLTFDSLFLQRDDRQIEYRGGIFRTSGRGLSFSGEQDIAGIRVASTLNTRTDLAFAYGTPISISLASRARVDVLKENRLISSQFYDAGNHMLDTSMLPEGAYDITIRINEGGRIREEVRFFSKSSRIPPVDQPLFTFEAGALLNNSSNSIVPEHTGEWLGRLGHSRRLTQNFGFDVGATFNAADQLLEFGVFRIDSIPHQDGSYYQVEASAFGGSGNSRGFRAQGNLRFGSVYASADFRKVIGGAAGPAELDRPTLLPAESTQSNVTIQFPLLGGIMGLTATETSRPNTDDRWYRSLTYRRTLRRTGIDSAELKADLTWNDDDLLVLVGVRFYVNRGRWSADLTPRYRYEDRSQNPSDHGYQLDATSRLSDPDFGGGALRLAANGTTTGSGDSLGLSAGYDNHLLQSDVSLNHVSGDGRSETSWAGTVVTSVLGSGDTWTLGGQNASDAAILVTLDGQSPDTEFEVLVNGYKRGYARGSGTTALLLAPYQQYDVAIRPRRSTFVDFDDSSRSVTLYPGNVVELTWEVKPLLVILGRLTDQQGAPIAGARVENAQNLSITDADGYFQAEIGASDRQVRLQFRLEEKRCDVSATIDDQRNGVAFLPTLICEAFPVPATDDRDPDAPGHSHQIGATINVSSPE